MRERNLAATSFKALMAMAIFAGITTSAAAAPPPVAKLPNVPTVKDASKAVVFNPGQFTFRSGILSCSKLTLGSCIVANMQTLWQGDPSVGAELEKYLKHYAVNGEITDKSGAAYTVEKYSNDVILGNGCYDASIVTMINAALADRLPAVSLSKRTKEFDDLVPSAGLSKIQQQLLWQYKHTYETSHGIKKGGKVVQPMFFHEVVADIGDGTKGIKEGCDPYTYGACVEVKAVNGRAESRTKFNPSKTELTDAAAQKLLQGGTLVLLAYQRWFPATSFDAKTGILTVTFAFNGEHKVAVSGFQPGALPLQISDVGSGERRNVHISTRPFAKENGVKSIVYKFTPSPKASAPSANTPFLVYEGDTKPTEVRFIRQYDTLKIISK
jgi:hypothetical protein